MKEICKFDNVMISKKNWSDKWQLPKTHMFGVSHTTVGIVTVDHVLLKHQIKILFNTYV